VTKLSILLGLTCLGVLAACGGDSLVLPSEGEPAHITIVQGSPQSGRVGETLAESLVVEVTDGTDRLVPGATVVFQLTGGSTGTQLLPDTVTTGSDGRASSQVVLGTQVGATNGVAQVVVAANRNPVQASFTVTALPASANGLSAVSGDNQTAPAGSALPAPLVAKVTDAFGNPVSGVTISWAPTGGGSLSAGTTQTGDDGQTSVQFTLGPAAGPQSVTASAEGLAGSPLIFNLTATPGTASGISIVSGNGQTGAAGAPLTAALVVKVADGSGNPVSGATVTWTVTAGGGNPNPASGTTDANGQAATTWTLGATPGTNTLAAAVAGVGSISFTATGVSGAPSGLAVQTQPSQTARIGTPFGRQPVIQVRDGQGNDVAQSGVSVTAAVASGGGTLGGTTTRVTDGQGRATFTDLQINGAGGPHTLIFAAAGYTSVNSNSIDVQKASTTTTITSDQPDPSAPNAAVTVAFTVTSSAGTPTGTVQVTVSGGSESCSAAVSAGSCSITLTATGSRTLAASYSGDATFDPSSDTEGHLVVAPNSPPNASDDSYSTTEDIAQFSVPAPGVLANDSDPDGNPLQAEKVSDPANGSVTFHADGSFEYKPNANFSGNDSFTYRATDGTAFSAAATVHLTVQLVNDPPSFQIGPNQTVSAATATGVAQTVNPWATQISAGPANESGQTLQFLVVADDHPELFSAGPAVSTDGTLTYTPAGGQGTAQISVQLKDDGGTANGGNDTSPAQTFTITIGP
jgi:Bacterial Ig domain/Bacterial Ig-like domain (group 1)